MLKVIAQSINGGESPVNESFWSVSDVMAYVPSEFRGLSSYYAVKIMDGDRQIGRAYRSGRNGTGERWAWEFGSASR